MKHELRLTDIGEGLEEAEIITWLVAVGDEVARDQPIVEVMTDKSNAELPAPSAGRVLALGEAVGSIVHVGDLLAVIEANSEADTSIDASSRRPPAAGSGPAPNASTTASAAVAPTPPPTVDDPPRNRPKASPSTRRAAAERGIDLGSVVGSGPGGRILLSDLDQPGTTPAPGAFVAATSPQAEPQSGPRLKAAVSDLVGETGNEAPAPTPVSPAAAPPTSSTAAPSSAVVAPPVEPGEVQPLRGVRRVIARNMAQSWSEIPHIHAFQEIDAEPLLALRARIRATNAPAYAALTPLSFFVAAVADALRMFPQVNASLDMDAGTITFHPEINLGVAVAAPQGLVVPVLRNAGQLDFEAISHLLSELIAGARAGTLAAEHFQHGTATITNFGSLGGEQATPLIRPPESIIIGFGSIDTRPFVIEGDVVARKTMHLVIGADHRLLDGDVTTAVLNHVAESLRDPLGLVL